MSKGGRKVYRQGQYAKKKRLKKIFGVFFSFIVLAALVFVGYSVAEPIYKYLSTESENTEEPAAPWTPPVFTEKAENNDTDKKDKTDDKDGKEENKSDKNEQVPEENFTACVLPDEAITSESKLEQSLSQAKGGGYNAVIVILKSKGGRINYNSSSSMAAMDENAVKGTLTAYQIAEAIKKSGLKSIAYINLLEDNNRYGEGKDGSFHSTDGTTWLDNSPSNGGKPWISPFESWTQSYVGQLSGEAANAGFEIVIAGGVRFPAFRNSDLNLIGESVKRADRYKSLVNIANISRSAVTGNKKDFMLEVSASGIINGTEEVFRPESLMGVSIIADYSPAEFESTIVYNNREIVLSEYPAPEKFAAIFGIISEKAGPDTTVIPMIKHDDYTQADFSDVITMLIDLGYKSYIIK